MNDRAAKDRRLMRLLLNGLSREQALAAINHRSKRTDLKPLPLKPITTDLEVPRPPTNKGSAIAALP